MISPDAQLKAAVTFLTPENGGRALVPCLKTRWYRPHLRVPPNDSLLGVEFIDGPEGPTPLGTVVSVTLRLVYEPEVSYISLQPGVDFEVLEGARLVGSGRVLGQ